MSEPDLVRNGTRVPMELAGSLALEIRTYGEFLNAARLTEGGCQK